MSKRLKERVQTGVDDQQKPVYKWAAGYNAAELQLDIARILVEAGMLEGVKPQLRETKKLPTLREFIDQEYRPAFIANLELTTQENYESYIKLNILPFMGDMRMDEINVATVQRFYDWMANAASHGRRKNLNKCTITRVGGLLGRIFRVAVEMGIISESPIKKTLLRIRAEEGGHHTALPDAEVLRIKKEIPALAVRNERIYMALLVFTGMRPEEVMGLRWEDLNLDRQYAQVQRAVTYPKKHLPVIKGTKTKKSVRTVILPKVLVDILRPCEEPSGFICGGEQPWTWTVLDNIKRRVYKKLRINGFSCYDFRSTYGSQLKESGLSSAIIADLMGHTDTRMVETVYARTRHEGVMKQLEAVEAINSGITAGL
ncbi:MAG: site-specific integrase [Clostridia bacterium]|nr:site-specific integrase [Clostridia bacterium]